VIYNPLFSTMLSLQALSWLVLKARRIAMRPIMNRRAIPALLLLAGTTSVPVLSQTKTPAPRTDASIEAEVRGILYNEVALQEKGDAVVANVKGGIVTLSGKVTSEAGRVLASRDIAEVRGVKTVLNDLTVTAANTTPLPGTAAPAMPTTTAQADHTKLLELPARTQIPVRLQEEVDTKTAKEGDTFHATVAANVFHNGYPLIPVGTPVLGRVVESKPAGRLVGFALLSVELVAVRLPVPDGNDQDMSVVTQQVSSRNNGRGAGTAAAGAGGAGLGGLIGALGGGGKGAAIGATSGAALGVGARALTPGQQIDLKPEALLVFTTEASFSVPVVIHNGVPALRDPANGEASLKTRPPSVSQ